MEISINKEIVEYVKSQIVDVSVPYITLEGKHTTGIIQVNKRIAEETKEMFQRLERFGFRINKIEPSKGRSDRELIDNNITTSYNFRLAISPNGPKVLSKHAWGLAIDINPRINPAEPDCGMDFEYGCELGVLNDKEIEMIKSLGFDWGGEIFKGFWDSHHFEAPFNEKELLIKKKFDI